MAFLRLTVLVLALLAAGCGGDDDEAAPSTTAPEQAAERSPRCVAADSSLMTPLGNGMKDAAHRLKNGQTVESEDKDGIYFVSAEIYGAGVEEGTIGTWATTSLGGAEAIWTVDEVAKQFSTLRDGTQVEGLSTDDDGAQESRDCVEAAR